jgi:hypothetical protein
MPAHPWGVELPRVERADIRDLRRQARSVFLQPGCGEPTGGLGREALLSSSIFPARMRAESEGEEVSYHSLRLNSGSEFRGRYGQVAPVELRPPGSVEHW